MHCPEKLIPYVFCDHLTLILLQQSGQNYLSTNKLIHKNVLGDSKCPEHK